MKKLIDIVVIEHRTARSVNLERELESPSPLEGFIATEQVLDGVRRLLAACEQQPGLRAWSVTGPYGAGKSSFAHFLCALLGPAGEPSEAAARSLLRKANPGLARDLVKARRSLEVNDRGFIRAVVTAQREPIASAIARALLQGSERYWSGRRGRPPKVLHELREIAAEIKQGNHAEPAVLLDALESMISAAPVMIVVDELGKALEYAADRSSEADLYILQQIAEWFSSSEEIPGCFLALQHLAFEDYASGLSPSRRREWRKIQGRFEDVAFIGGTGHAAKLIGGSLRLTEKPEEILHAMAGAVGELLELAPDLRATLDSLGPAPAGYPLHPTALPALIELAGRFGQHDRSLMAFLTSDAPDALQGVLRRTSLESQHPRFVRLADIYDYYIDGAASLALVGEEAVRLREIRNRIRDAPALSALERVCLKTVGVLNLVGHGSYTANEKLLLQSVAGPAVSDADAASVKAALEKLSEHGLTIYREFAGEYRIWQGSDFDVAGAIAEHREQLARDAVLVGPPVDQISAAFPSRPVVARRHSQRMEVLRYFETRYEVAIPTTAPTGVSPQADGLLIFALSTDQSAADTPVRFTDDGRPLAVIATPHLSDMAEAALDAAATRLVLETTEDLPDVTARSEIRYRAAVAQVALSEQVEAAFDPSRPGVMCFAGGRRLEVGSLRAFSEALSTLCDATYSRTPRIRNEMLNRRELTSQGAKARRELILRMFDSVKEPRMGITGFGPDRAIYESVFAASGMHQERNGTLSIGPPQPSSGLAPAWEAINEFFDATTDGRVGVDQLFDHLMAPPFGMKAGPIPLLLAAALLHRADDVFVFEEGSFLPRLRPEHFERLMKTPGRFSLKRAAMLGVRADVFRSLEELLGATPTRSLAADVRNSTTLSVVRPLIGLLQGLPEYSQKTRSVSETAQRVRHALATTTDPDELLFSRLPAACEIEQISEGNTAGYISALTAALDELTGAYGALLEEVAATLRTAFSTRGPAHALREELRSRSRHLVEHVIDRRLRSFLLMAANEELEDTEWLEAIATVLAQKPPGSWADADKLVFDSATLEVARPFRRLELLHLQMGEVRQPGFSAQRLTVTLPDGTERSQLLWLDESRTSMLGQIVETALTAASRAAGTEGVEGLLALLAERVLTEPQATTKAVDDDSTKRARTA